MDRKDLKAEKVKKVKEIPSIAAMVEKTFGRAMEKLQNARMNNKRAKIEGQQKVLEYNQEYSENQNNKQKEKEIKEEAISLKKRISKFLDEHKGQILGYGALAIMGMNLIAGGIADLNNNGKYQDYINKGPDNSITVKVVDNNVNDNKENNQESNEVQEKEKSNETSAKKGSNKGSNQKIETTNKANNPNSAPVKGGTKEDESKKTYKDTTGGTQKKESQQRQQNDINEGKKSEKLKEEKSTEKTTDYTQGQEKNNEGAKEGKINHESGKVVKDEDGPSYGEDKIDITKVQDNQTSVSKAEETKTQDADDWYVDVER